MANHSTTARICRRPARMLRFVSILLVAALAIVGCDAPGVQPMSTGDAPRFDTARFDLSRWR
jgi:hypothetical protein